MGADANGAGTNWPSDVMLLYLGVFIGLTLLVGLVFLFGKMRKIRREYRESIAKRYASGDILCHDNMANYLGMEVYEGKQVRGNGVLVLANNELYFLRLQPRLELIIPLKRIRKVISPSMYLGKPVLKPILKVDYKDDTGILNSVAWYVRDLETLRNALKLQIKKVVVKKKRS